MIFLSTGRLSLYSSKQPKKPDKGAGTRRLELLPCRVKVERCREWLIRPILTLSTILRCGNLTTIQNVAGISNARSRLDSGSKKLATLPGDMSESVAAVLAEKDSPGSC
jgi:hypothetical protein